MGYTFWYRGLNFVKVKLDLRDLWVGLYITRMALWYRPPGQATRYAVWHYKLYLCLVPMLPIVIGYGTRRKTIGGSRYEDPYGNVTHGLQD